MILNILFITIFSVAAYNKKIVSLITVLVVIKSLLILKYNLRPAEKEPAVTVEPGLGPAFDHQTQTFKIFNENNISFQLVPSSCSHPPPLLLLTVSSGPAMRISRDKWRANKDHAEKVRVIFLVSGGKQEHKLIKEQEEHGDILQSSLPDGHRKLGYKILTGYVWAEIHCPEARFIGKTDDNAVLDLNHLVNVLEERAVEWKGQDIISCGTPIRNARVSREEKGGMGGNWSLTLNDFPHAYMPEFCIGWFYLTTPRVGAALVQAGNAVYSDIEVQLIEDYLITGVLRERLPWVQLKLLEPSWSWDKTIHCPNIAFFANHFLNSFVLTKKSSRSEVQYVGPITSLTTWRFVSCFNFEGELETIEKWTGLEVPQLLWDICAR